MKKVAGVVVVRGKEIRYLGRSHLLGDGRTWFGVWGLREDVATEFQCDSPMCYGSSEREAVERLADMIGSYSDYAIRKRAEEAATLAAP